MPSPLLTPGRILLLLSNLFYVSGAFAFDFGPSHIYNDLWPPHAKFHNGQTMSSSALLALLSFYLTLRPIFETLSPKEERFSVWCATVVGCIYCVAGLAAILYPGTWWCDPEFPVEGRVTQREIFVGQVASAWVAYALEVRRIGKGAKLA